MSTKTVQYFHQQDFYFISLTSEQDVHFTNKCRMYSPDTCHQWLERLLHLGGETLRMTPEHSKSSLEPDGAVHLQVERPSKTRSLYT